MPKDHQKYIQWNGERFIKWAEKIGVNTATVVKVILCGYKVEQQGYEATAQRTDIAYYMDVTPTGTESGSEIYRQLGAGWTAVTESPSAQTKSRKFINEKSERENITRYKPRNISLYVMMILCLTDTPLKYC